MTEDAGIQDFGPLDPNTRNQSDDLKVDDRVENKKSLREKFLWNLYGWSYDNSLCGRL